MQIILKGKNIELTDALRGYALEKIGKSDRYFQWASKIEIELSVEMNPSIAESQGAEVTVFANNGPSIRANAKSPDMYASIDEIADKLEKQLKKYKEKIEAKNHKESIRKIMLEERAEAGVSKVVKVKQFVIKPMSIEEAAMQMEVLGHDFFLFTNVDTEQPNVIYKRKNGDYGLIEPTL